MYRWDKEPFGGHVYAVNAFAKRYFFSDCNAMFFSLVLFFPLVFPIYIYEYICLEKSKWINYSNRPFPSCWRYERCYVRIYEAQKFRLGYSYGIMTIRPVQNGIVLFFQHCVRLFRKTFNKTLFIPFYKKCFVFIPFILRYTERHRGQQFLFETF